MALAQTGEQFAGDAHVTAEPEMPVGRQALQVDQTGACALDPFAHEVIRLADIGSGAEHFAVGRVHSVHHAIKCIRPAQIAAVIGKAGINPRFAGFFVFQQQVGNPAIGRNHKDAVVGVFAPVKE